jgi:hypothetical protein
MKFWRLLGEDVSPYRWTKNWEQAKETNQCERLFPFFSPLLTHSHSIVPGGLLVTS